MIDTVTKQEILDHFNTLPPEVKSFINGIQLEQELNAIQETTPLQDEQKTAIQNEILLIFLGLSDVVSLTTNIRNGAQISRDRAEKISKAIQQEILMPNFEILEKVFEIPEEEHKISTEDVKRVPTTSQKKIEHKSLVQQTRQNLPQQTPNEHAPTKTPVAQSPQKPIPHPSNVFKNKLSGPMLIKNEEEKISVESHNEDKPKHVDPYRESVD